MSNYCVFSDDTGGFQKTRKPKRYDWDEKPSKDKKKKKDYTDQRKTKRGELFNDSDSNY